MYVLLSGEGSSDLGICEPSAASCDRAGFRAGPMAYIVDQCVEICQGYEMSHLEVGLVGYVSESYLAQHKQPTAPKSMALRGKKKPAETRYYYENARALAAAAQQKSIEFNDCVIAVLFRDADGTASAGRGQWQDKYDSMQAGFAAADFKFGVPMLPKPKSEAWLLCAVKPNPYQHCAQLEDESGNDHAANPLKAQLSIALDGHAGTADLNDLIIDRRVDIQRIDMPSFNQFKADLCHVVALAMGR